MIRRINFSFIVLFFIAIWFLGQSGKFLGLLQNTQLSETIRNSKGNTEVLANNQINNNSLTNLLIASGIVSTIFLIIGLIVSLKLCRNHNIQKINAIIAFIFAYAIGFFQIYTIKVIQKLLRIPGEYFDGVLVYVSNGAISFLLGLLTFSLISKYLNSKNRVPTNSPHSA